MTRLIFVPALLLALSAPAAAQVRTAVDVAAEFVIGTCYRSIDDTSRVRSMAAILKWSPLSKEMANAMKPVDGAGYQGWHVIHEGQHFFVGINRGFVNGRDAEVCSVVANQPPDTIVPAVLRSLKARLRNRDSDGLQINEIYELDHPTQRSAAIHIVRGSDKEPPVNFGFIGFK